MTEQVKIPQAIKQQIALLNARITNVNISLSDLLREMDVTFKAFATRIAELEKENTELKAKKEKTLASTNQ